MTSYKAMLAAGVAAGAMATISGVPVRAQQVAAVAAPAAEQKYQQANPTLYEIARQYFPGDESEISAKRIFRLTRDQIDASVQSLLPDYYKSSVKEMMGRDPLQTNYEYAELLNFNAANSGGLTDWIKAIAQRVGQNPAGVINCTADAPKDCLKAQARAFVIKAFRNDVPEAKVEAIAKFFLSGVASVGLNQAAAELVEIVLNSPHFLFRKELDTNAKGRMTPAQLLQSVTYTIADVPPDKLGLASAEASQYLRNGQEAYTTLNSIIASKEAREKLHRFFMAWLEVKDPVDFTISPMVFPEFTPALTTAMLAETKAFLTTQLSKPQPSLKDITQSTQTTLTKPMEAIYGLPANSSGNGKTVSLNPAQRYGIFSQPAVLASQSGPTNTRLVRRGVFWARKVMCMDLEPPPPGTTPELPEKHGVTERERIEGVTKAPDCIGCHKVINPFAFFQENYDALGRWRTDDNGGKINPNITVDFLDEHPEKNKPFTANNPVDALKTFTSSAMFKQCFVRQAFRFYMGRKEEPSDDPLLRRIFLEFTHEDKQDILALVYNLTSSDRVVKRQ